jgi:hypothetical protein
MAEHALREFILFVDTNAIWTEDVSIVLLSSEFRRQWEAICNRGDVKLVIPDVVLTELAYQKYRHIEKTYQQAKGALSGIDSTLGIGLPELPDMDRAAARKAVRNALVEQIGKTPHCSRMPIPYDRVRANIEIIAESSLWRVPPFKEGAEAGFRDALILETVRELHARHLHCDIAFFCHDERLKQATRRAFAKATNFGLVSSLEEYKAFLDAARNKFPPEFLHAVTAKAQTVFRDTVWKTLSIPDEVAKRFDLVPGRSTFMKTDKDKSKSITLGELFAGTGFPSYYKCLSEPAIEALPSHLLAVVGKNEFHWGTTLLVSTQYASALGAATTLLTGPAQEKPPVTRLMVVSVEWKALIAEDETFSAFDLQRMQLQHDSLEERAQDSGIARVAALLAARAGSAEPQDRP